MYSFRQMTWRAFAHAESAIVLLHYFERSCCLKTLIGSFVLLHGSRLIASSVSSETKETDNEASWLAC